MKLITVFVLNLDFAAAYCQHQQVMNVNTGNTGVQCIYNMKYELNRIRQCFYFLN